MGVLERASDLRRQTSGFGHRFFGARLIGIFPEARGLRSDARFVWLDILSLILHNKSSLSGVLFEQTDPRQDQCSGHVCAASSTNQRLPRANGPYQPRMDSDP